MKTPWIVQVKEYHGDKYVWKVFMPYLTLFRQRVKYSVVAKGTIVSGTLSYGDVAAKACRYVPAHETWRFVLV